MDVDLRAGLSGVGRSEESSDAGRSGLTLAGLPSEVLEALQRGATAEFHRYPREALEAFGKLSAVQPVAPEPRPTVFWGCVGIWSDFARTVGGTDLEPLIHEFEGLLLEKLKECGKDGNRLTLHTAALDLLRTDALGKASDEALLAAIPLLARGYIVGLEWWSSTEELRPPTVKPSIYRRAVDSVQGVDGDSEAGSSESVLGCPAVIKLEDTVFSGASVDGSSLAIPLLRDTFSEGLRQVLGEPLADDHEHRESVSTFVGYGGNNGYTADQRAAFWLSSLELLLGEVYAAINDRS